MRDFIFSLGIIDKKLIWLFLYTTIQIVQTIIDTYYPEDKKSSTVSGLSSGIGESLIILIPYVLDYKNPNRKKEKNAQSPIYYIIFS